MVTELRPWIYVNGLLCRTMEARDQLIRFYTGRGETITITPVEVDEFGRYIVNEDDGTEDRD